MLEVYSRALGVSKEKAIEKLKKEGKLFNLIYENGSVYEVFELSCEFLASKHNEELPPYCLIGEKRPAMCRKFYCETARSGKMLEEHTRGIRSFIVKIFRKYFIREWNRERQNFWVSWLHAFINSAWRGFIEQEVVCRTSQIYKELEKAYENSYDAKKLGKEHAKACIRPLKRRF